MTDHSKIPLTVIVSTKNEERAIERCLASLTDFDEVLVVDSMSSDDTARLARDRGLRVINFEWNGFYPKKKQWCLDNIQFKNQWLLFIDADERPSQALVDELRRITEKSGNPYKAYDVKLSYHFAGEQLEHGHTVVKRALIMPSHVRFPVLDDLDAPGMGELEGHYQPVVRGLVGHVGPRLIHDDPDLISSWVDRHNRYSDWEAYLRLHPERLRAVRSLRSRQGRMFDRLPFKPLIFFLYSYLVRQGFRDGRPGLNYALALTFYYWLIDVKVREARRAR